MRASLFQFEGVSARRTFAWMLALCCFAFWRTSTADGIDYLPVKEIESGMAGKVRTVLKGKEVVEHPVEVIDVMEGYLPKDEVILVRLKGDVLEHTGVIRGMSGSPIYVDGRWIGSVAYAWSFAKEPIAGVTPAESMVQMIEEKEDLSTEGEGLSSGLEASEIPLVFSGLSKATLERAGELFEEGNHFVVAGGRTMEKQAFDSLLPGSPLAVVLATGDASVSGIGTVSAVEGNRVLAFGHPMMGGLENPLPMAHAWVHTVLPSQMVSFKLSSIGPVIGAIVADGPSGIMGEIGASAPTFSLRVVARSKAEEKEVREQYDYEVSCHRSISPGLVELLTGDSLESSRMIGPLATLYARSEFRFEEMEAIVLEDMYSGTSSGYEVGEWVGQVFDLFYTNKFQKVSPLSVEVSVRVEEGRRVAEIGRVWLEDRVFRPGDALSVHVELEPWRQEKMETMEIPLKLPLNCPPGRYALWVLSGLDAMRHTRARAPFTGAPKSLKGLKNVVAAIPRNDQIVVRLTARKPSLGVNARELSGLPASVWGILADSRREGRVFIGKESLFLEEVKTTDWVTLGGRSLAIEVESR